MSNIETNATLNVILFWVTVTSFGIAFMFMAGVKELLISEKASC